MPRHEMHSYRITAPPAAAPQRSPAPRDPQSTNRAGQRSEGRDVRKMLVQVTAKRAGMKIPGFGLKQATLGPAEQCQRVH